MREKLFGWADEGAGAEGGSRLLCMREKEFLECRRGTRKGAVSITGDRVGGDGEVVADEGEEGEEVQGLDVKRQIDWWTTRAEVEHQLIHTSKSTFR